MSKKNVSYSEAMSEIESIIRQMEDGDLDIDILGEKVKRVTELINLCKEKLHKTEEEVNKILSGEENES